MEHSWSREKNVRRFGPDERFIKGFDFLKRKDTFSVFKFFLDFFVLPVDEKLVVSVGLLNKTC